MCSSFFHNKTNNVLIGNNLFAVLNKKIYYNMKKNVNSVIFCPKNDCMNLLFQRQRKELTASTVESISGVARVKMTNTSIMHPSMTHLTDQGLLDVSSLA